MIELPPGWIPAFKAAGNKATFLRDWADQLWDRACWAADKDRMAELVDAARGALGEALDRSAPPAPYDGAIVRTFSGRHWPDPENGPWLVILQWQVQNGELVCIGMEITSAALAVTTTDDPIWMDLPPLGTPLTTTVLRGLRLGQLIQEDRAELEEVAEALTPLAAKPQPAST